MEKLMQEYILSILFTQAIQREELLKRKYIEYGKTLKNQELASMMQEFREVGEEHVNLLKDKMLKLNIQG